MLQFIDSLNNFLWTYFLIGALFLCALWFTIRTRGVQFRMFGEMCRLITETGTGRSVEPGHKRISSFQAFMVSLASRIGTGNLAGVASAIALGGPGAVFWMWIMALLGSATSFVESTLAQIFKTRGEDSYVGGPAYYMQKGLGKRWMGVIFSVLVIFTFSLANNSVQSNTIGEAMEGAFGWSHVWVGIVITAVCLPIFFGGIQRIAKVSGVVVPIMAVSYLALALVVVALNIKSLPSVLKMIVDSAFGWHQAAGGAVGAAIMMGVKRGLFSNEAGEGSTPNAAATADVTHPVKQGLAQALGVFTDTIVICSCTAFIILCSGVDFTSCEGVQLTQLALEHEIGGAGRVFVAVAIFFFAFSTLLGNYYYGEANIRFITSKKWPLTLVRLSSAGMVLFGSIASLHTVWALVDVCMAFMTALNLIAIVPLSKYALKSLIHYCNQRKAGIASPEFKKEDLPEIADKIECW